MRTLPVVDAAQELQGYIKAAQKGSKIFYGPLYDAFLLNSPDVFDPATRNVTPRELEFFQSSVGQRGGGFQRAKRFTETNLQGAQGSLPAGYSYIAHSLGLIFPVQQPAFLKDHLAFQTSIRTERMSNKWDAGLGALWPEASFGVQSRAAATTVANTTIDFGVNGAVASRQFPRNAMLYFPANEIISIILVLYVGVNVTTDGLAWNGGIDGVDPGGNGIPVDSPAGRIYLSMEGWRFEKLST
jgi:hypothetical protein